MTATRRAAWQAYSISRSSSHSNALASSRYCTILQRDQIRHATSSRIPAARPSRISPRPIQHNRRTGPSHTQREIEPNKEVTADCEDGKRTKFETTSVAGENESDSNALTAEPKEENKEIINPSDIESILGQDTLVVTRQVEMMNIFLGFEQSNKYAINSAQGEPVGYLAESEKGIMGGSIQRQVLRTHRPFEAQILDTNGNILLIIKRPFTFINSKISIYTLDPITKDEVLVGQVHQIFHVIRRKYELFINRGGEKGHEELEQFADIDEGLWAWDFMLKDDQGRPLGAISRNFRGFGREICTDTGQYVLTFDPTTLNSDLRIEEGKEQEKSTMAKSTAGRELVASGPSRHLSTKERAVALATAISADFDYFSRHSQGSTGGFMPWFWMGGGGGGSKEAEPVPQGQNSSGVEAPPPAPGSGGTGADVGTAAGYGMFGGGSQSEQGDNGQWEPSPSGDQAPPPPSQGEYGEFGSPAPPPDDFGQGQDDVMQDPWAEQTGVGDSSSSWDWSDIFGGGD